MTVFDNATRGIKLVGCAVSMEIAEATRRGGSRGGRADVARDAAGAAQELKKRGFFQGTETA